MCPRRGCFKNPYVPLTLQLHRVTASGLPSPLHRPHCLRIRSFLLHSNIQAVLFILFYFFMKSQCELKMRRWSGQHPLLSCLSPEKQRRPLAALTLGDCLTLTTYLQGEVGAGEDGRTKRSPWSPRLFSYHRLVWARHCAGHWEHRRPSPALRDHTA